METIGIDVNKTAENPDGIKINIVEPQSPLEEKLLSHLLAGFLQNSKLSGNLQLDLPDAFRVEHTSKGSFLVTALSSEAGYYSQPTPIAIVAIRSIGNTFDLVSADLRKRGEKK